MSDVESDQNAGSPSPDEDEPTAVERERPEEQAHGGSMAPGLVDPTGQSTSDLGRPDPGE
jgi:hypothetical protein